MKIVITITLVLAIITSASIGSLVIFDVMTAENGKELFIKAQAAIILLGVSAALIALLTGKKNTPAE